MSNTIKFRLNNKGELEEVKKNILREMRDISPLTSRVDPSRLKNISLSLAPLPIIMATSGITDGVFWGAFMTYIFPYIIDVAKVFCVIKIAQGFYQERSGGRESGGGFSNFVTYGKWLLLFHLIPFFVLLIDELGLKMVNDLKVNPINQ